MRSRTDTALLMLLWAADLLCRPSYRLYDDSFEAWTYRHGLHPHLRKLERRGLVESCPAHPAGQSKVIRRLHRLTPAGLLQTLGGRVPPERWNRDWDGLWRLVVFDVPEKEACARQNLRRLLRSFGCGRLQRSVWITPDPLDPILEKLVQKGADVQSLLTWQGRPAAGEPDLKIVRGAWDFDKINQLHRSCLRILKAKPSGDVHDAGCAQRLLSWGQQEQSAWLAAVSADPLLPKRLLPPGYLGEKVWRKRVKTLAAAGLQLQSPS